MTESKHCADGRRETSTDLEGDLVWAIRLVSGALRQVTSEAASDLPGGTRSYMVLLALAGNQGDHPTQLILAGQVGLDRTVMTYLLDDLENQDLIARRPHPRDRRARQVVLTDNGRSVFARVRADVTRAEARMFAALSENETAQFRALLSTVAATAQREWPI